MERVKQYEARYEPVDDAEECAYIKLVNVGDKVITRRCGGYLTSQLGFYLGNVHIQPRRIWLALHGESQLQVESRRVGGRDGSPHAAREVLRETVSYFRERRACVIYDG